MSENTEVEVDRRDSQDQHPGDGPDAHLAEADSGTPPSPPDDEPRDLLTDPPTGEADEVAPPTGQAGSESDRESPVSVSSVIEAILFASERPLTAARIARLLAGSSAREVREHIQQLNQRYEANGASFRIEETAGGYQMLTLPDFHPWLSRLRQTRAMNRLTKPALETVAVVAYKQPVLRAEIEAIRGVASGEVLNRLREMGLVAIVGRAEVIGRPMLYGTTRRFLEVFGLSRIEDLPAVEELKPPS